MFDFFDRIVVVNLNNRPDRRDSIKSELLRVGVDDFEFYEATAHNDGKIGFNSTMRSLVEDYFNLGVKNLLVLEDDAYFLTTSGIKESIEDLPEDYDLFYLGANLVEATVSRYSSRLYEVRGAWTTHAVGYSREALEYILDSYDDNTYMFDVWLGEYVHPRGKSYVMSPMVAFQRPGYSNIWNRDTDYTQYFESSKFKLNGKPNNI